MPHTVAERAALITGGSSGIGFAIAKALGDEGYAVTISGRREDKLAAAVEDLRQGGIEVQGIPGRADDEQALIDLVNGHVDKYGRIDVLVNSAGVGIGGQLEGYETKFIDMQLAVNIRAMIITTREAMPHLKAAAKENANGMAHVFNLASIAGRYGQPWLSLYAATKAAVANWTNGMHKEFQNEGIRFTALSPAFVETPMTEFAKQGGVPGEKMIRPEDLSSAVLWLLQLSPNARVPEIVFERVGDDLF
jgi:NAD(P)-dependent dehydrogenase (short-subunit alcohol dehydrogenase family)